jgi:hypothetical protein
MKKTAKKRQASKSRGVVAKAKSRSKKVGKKMMAKAGLSKAAVKKKVVKKLKRVGVAMARAAMDELVPPDSGSTPGAPAKGQRGTKKGAASANPS